MATVVSKVTDNSDFVLDPICNCTEESSGEIQFRWDLHLVYPLLACFLVVTCVSLWVRNTESGRRCCRRQGERCKCLNLIWPFHILADCPTGWSGMEKPVTYPERIAEQLGKMPSDWGGWDHLYNYLQEQLDAMEREQAAESSHSNPVDVTEGETKSENGVVVDVQQKLLREHVAGDGAQEGMPPEADPSDAAVLQIWSSDSATRRINVHVQQEEPSSALPLTIRVQHESQAQIRAGLQRDGQPEPAGRNVTVHVQHDGQPITATRSVTVHREVKPKPKPSSRKIVVEKESEV